MSTQAAAAYAALGGDLDRVEIDDSPNPLTCPECGIVKPTGWSTGRVTCADCGTLIAWEVDPDEPA